MKYIRTKDGIFERKFPNKEQQISFDHKTIEPAYYTVKYDWIAKKDVIKESDNPEDLCDEFVWVTPEGKHRIKKPKTGVALLYLCCDYKQGHQIYGAIWTDKGLIYVARMNKERKWELL